MWGWFFFTLAAGAIVLFALDRWLDALRAGAAGDQGYALSLWLQRLTSGLCVVFAIAALAFGVWLRRLATATQRDRRWPPTAMRTSSDIRVRYLTSADALVTQFRAGATILFVLAALLLAWGAWLALGA